MTKLHIIQDTPPLLDLDAAIAMAQQAIRVAAQDGADLVVFPETWLGGYPSWVFGMAGWDSAEARHWFGKLVEASLVLDSAPGRALCDAAREAGITVVMGINERARSSASILFNSMITIGPDGTLLNVHRKLLPTHTERNVWAPGDAAGLLAVDTPAGRIGGLVCWEHWHPLARHALHASDEQIHIAAWPDMPISHQLACRTYAFEGRCFVVSAATYLPVARVPEALREAFISGLGGEDGLKGGSGVVGPDGEFLVGPVFGGETVVATIDLADTIRFKHDLDVVGHYDRRDVFNLTVNRRREIGGAV
ncbi:MULTISPECIES: carbon-nitrogen hydrolase family protein [Rhizobium]|uniref:Carbon-nitrogen hydrolase n=1 Tax=Rhizobium wuzhouense TaxID=1986026 RepID=A0ABX5NPP2_9HYPH|nr:MULTISPECIES: carbon-nitrogen hydrolase family protein [Rhizobium]PYB72411.1 carbon-nitrogen hydrolase [Rhizobium wuzhouense]RKE83385.1 putative amidohydrolase [Rhizobium sp. AG855]